MTGFPRYLCLAAVLASTAALAAAPVADSHYPSRPVRIIVPWVAGGGTDIVARIFTPRLGDELGQQVVIDNRPGANGIVGSDIAAKATPDGYTLALEAVEHVINASTRTRLPYDTIKDFAPIGLVAGHSLVLIVPPSSPARSVGDLVALAQSKPGQLNFGSWGEGSLAHLAGELFKNSATIEMTHVPYKGAPQAIVDILGGRLPLMFTTMPTGVPPVRQGKLRALAVTSPQREPLLPEVPTMIESGYAGFQVESWRALYAPAGTPKAVITRLNRELVKVLNLPDIKERIAGAGFAPMSSTSEQLDAFSKAELAKWAKVARSAGVHVD